MQSYFLNDDQIVVWVSKLEKVIYIPTLF